MDPTQIIFNGILSVAGFLCAWQFKTLHESIKELQTVNNLHQKEISHLQNEQGRHDERGKSLKESLDAIFALLREMDKKLDTKADK